MPYHKDKSSQYPDPTTPTPSKMGRVWTKPQIRVMSVSFSTKGAIGSRTNPEDLDLDYGAGFYIPPSS